MVKFQVVIYTITLFTFLFIACSNGSKETSSDNTNSVPVENRSDSELKNLFIIDTNSINSRWVTIEEGNSKQRTATINPTFIAIDSSGVGQVFTFNIYDDENFEGEINRVSTDINGIKSISGLLFKDKGSFVFTVNEGRLLGQLRLADRNQLIQIGFHEELNEYVLTELQRKELDQLPGSAPLRRGNN